MRPEDPRPPGVMFDVFSHRYLAHAASQLPGRAEQRADRARP